MSMKALLIAAVAIGGVMYSDLNAQRGGGGGRGGGASVRPGGNPGGNAPGNPGRNFGGKPVAGLGNGLNRDWWSGGFGNRFGRQGFGSLNYGWGYGTNGWGYPAYYSDSAWPATYGDGNEAPPSVVLMMPMQAPAEPLPPPPPPEPAVPVMHVYAWPDAGGDPHATFSIASRDGFVHSAVAVWVQGNEVGFTAADGRAGRMPQASIDCGATQKLNAENKLRLSLPGCRSTQTQ
jgi:hypothetical protein